MGHTQHQSGHCFSDFWNAYQAIIPEEQLTQVGKETGETAHVERWNCTLRQHLGRFVRETLSFSRINTHAYRLLGPFSSSLQSGKGHPPGMTHYPTIEPIVGMLKGANQMEQLFSLHLLIGNGDG